MPARRIEMRTSTFGPFDIPNSALEFFSRPHLVKQIMYCVVALPGQLVSNTQIRDCLWFLAKIKNADTFRRHQTNAALFKA